MPFVAQLPPVFVTTFVNANALEALAYAARLEGISVERLLSGLLAHVAEDVKLLERVAKAAAASEAFRCRGRIWDVAKAWKLIADRPPNFVYKLDEKARRQSKHVYVNLEYMMQTDLSKPVLLVHDRQWGLLPIDGNHRIAKALLLRRESLQAHLLSKEEEALIRIRPKPSTRTKKARAKNGRK